MLAVLSIGLGAVVFLRQKQVVTMREEARSLSGQLADVRAILTSQQNVAAEQASNLLVALERSSNALASTSNQLLRANLALAQGQEQAKIRQSESDAQARRLVELESQDAAARAKLDGVPPLQKELGEMKEKLDQLSIDRESLSKANTLLTIEKAELSRKLQDANFLRLQIAKMQDAAEEKKHLAKRGSGALDRRSRLELQEDGTVKLVSITNEVARP